MFRYEGQQVPPMMALDTEGMVIYLTTYSKTLAPGLRVGAAVLPETLFGDRQASRALWGSLVRRKSVSTLNTSQISQAVVGGLLLQNNCSLRNWIQPAVAWYRQNRDAILEELGALFQGSAPGVHWNRPSGGFFLCLDLPFEFDSGAVVECAMKYGVTVMPMRFFSFDDSQDRRIRLAFSASDPDSIRTGVRALARYVNTRIGRESPGVLMAN
jgi:(S)-3,5-dihydroxyphenylglycine transaminase